MTNQNPDPNSEIERLREENEQLKAQLQRCLDFDRLNWHLLTTINTKLQLSSTSIKAAVSSLLDRDIFWDVASQQEFLETIQQSIDQIADRMHQMAVANLLQAGSLEVNRKFYELHELMRVVQEKAAALSGKELYYQDNVALGSLAYVDYRYFVYAFSTLFTVIDSDEPLQLTQDPRSAAYVLSLSRIAESVHTVIQSILSEQWAAKSLYRELPPEKIYELLLVIRLLEYQGIRLILDPSRSKGIRVEIPFGGPD
ncbi:MAG: hypothetical protein GX491_21830 [Chloroflexi bacterium]|nr:hypothetical protein [Chloroflexota bacterium]